MNKPARTIWPRWTRGARRPWRHARRTKKRRTKRPAGLRCNAGRTVAESLRPSGAFRYLRGENDFLQVYDTLPPFRKILIANRSEIALRIARACKELGIRTIAVYSEADRGALHVLEADEAYLLGPAPAAESYLRGDAILDTARRAGGDAIHPGYGFLSENADFVEACERAGVKFIGPPSSSMRALGSKTRARQAADAAGMPRTPGSTQGLTSLT